MAINIAKMRADMRWESRKFLVQLAVGIAAAVGAGTALGNYLARREPPPALPPQIIFQPGSIVVTPATIPQEPRQPSPAAPAAAPH